MYFCNIKLEAMQDIHNYDTRSKELIPSNVTRTIFAQNCIRNKLPSLLNKTNDAVISKVDTHSYKGFSNYAKKYIIDSYTEACLLQDCYICNRS